MSSTALQMPAWSEFLFRPSRYKVAYGGRGSGKSWAVARALVLLASERKLRILCTREFQNSISESCHELLSSQIRAMGLAHHFQVQQQGIFGANSSEFIFVGTGTAPEKVMSMEGVDICWIEQAERLSERSFEILIPTIRQPGSEIWATFNPDEETDPVWRRFVEKSPPDTIVVRVNHELNPWFPPELERERAYLASVDPEAAAHVWGGECRRNASAQIFHGKYVIAEFEPRDSWAGPYLGADWGFAADPTVLMRCWIDGRKLMVDAEAYGFSVELDDVPDLFDEVPDSRRYLIRADNSRPETIAHVKARGFRIEPCSKWDGSVEDGIAFLRSFEQIVIHPRCVRLQDEARLYSYKRDRLTGDVLPDIVGRHDHCWDSLRYALEPLVRKTRLAVYGDWTEEIICRDGDILPYLLESRVPHYVGVECGTARITAFVEVVDDGKTAWVLREYYWDALREGSQADVAEALIKFVEMSPVKSRSLEIMLKKSNTGLHERLIGRGLWAIEQDEDDATVIFGIRTVASAFAQHRVRIHEGCANTLRELQLYRWDADKQARGVEEPLKQNSFTCDALRRVASEIFQPWKLMEATNK